MLHFLFNYHFQTQAMQSQHNKSPSSMVVQFHELQTSRTLEIQSYGNKKETPQKKYIPNKQGELYEAELPNLHS